jgi:hypothetical protein
LRTPCRAHALLADQSALDHLVHVRRMRAWFVANEMDAPCPRQTVGGLASVPFVRAEAPCPIPAGRRHPAALPPEALDNLEALYEAHHRQALGLAYRELGGLNAAKAMVLDALLTVWRKVPEAVPTTEWHRHRLLALVRWRCRVQRAYRGGRLGVGTGPVADRSPAFSRVLGRLLDWIGRWLMLQPFAGLSLAPCGPQPATDTAEPVPNPRSPIERFERPGAPLCRKHTALSLGMMSGISHESCVARDCAAAKVKAPARACLSERRSR